jgi:hypothetical protein
MDDDCWVSVAGTLSGERDKPVEYCSEDNLGRKYWDLTEVEQANGRLARLMAMLESEVEYCFTGKEKTGSAERATPGIENIF